MKSESSGADPDLLTVEAQLDAARDRARSAYFRRDVGGVMAMFHPTLAYTRPDGRTIGYERFARDLSVQLERMETGSTGFRREALEVRDAEIVAETLEERTTFIVRAFGFLRREWTVSRWAVYEWVRNGGAWQVRRV